MMRESIRNLCNPFVVSLAAIGRLPDIMASMSWREIPYMGCMGAVRCCAGDSFLGNGHLVWELLGSVGSHDVYPGPIWEGV